MGSLKTVAGLSFVVAAIALTGCKQPSKKKSAAGPAIQPTNPYQPPYDPNVQPIQYGGGSFTVVNRKDDNLSGTTFVAKPFKKICLSLIPGTTVQNPYFYVSQVSGAEVRIFGQDGERNGNAYVLAMPTAPSTTAMISVVMRNMDTCLAQTNNADACLVPDQVFGNVSPNSAYDSAPVQLSLQVEAGTAAENLLYKTILKPLNNPPEANNNGISQKLKDTFAKLVNAGC